jgi:hypothetical protein
MLVTITLPVLASDAQTSKTTLAPLAQMYDNKQDNDSVKTVYNEILTDTIKKENSKELLIRNL